MGQYYKPVCLTEDKDAVKGFVYSHDIKSKFKRADGQVFNIGEGLKLMEHSYINNKLMRCIEALLIPGGPWYAQPIIWAGDYAEVEKHTGKNIYDMAEDETLKLIPKPLSLAQSKAHRYILNHSKKEYVDKQEVKKSKDGFTIHPLSLLTADGNGNGGGDYSGRSSTRLVGSWSRDLISLEKSVPPGYKKVIFKASR